MKKLRIAVDLDGTVLEYDTWHGRGEDLGLPLPGAKEALKTLQMEGHTLILYTTRLNPQMLAKDDISFEDELHHIRRHLATYDLDIFQEYTGSKPLADCYLDDRAIRFTDWVIALYDIEKLRLERQKNQTYMLINPVVSR